MALAVVLLPFRLSASPSLNSPTLQDGDRVVFLGDSITAGFQYTRYVEMYWRLRQPQLNIAFRNAGVGGHTVRNALDRLEHDVLAFRPSVVFVNFGMNDAGFTPPNEHFFYEANLTRLLDRLQEAKVRMVVLLEPTPYDVRGLSPKHTERQRQNRIREIAAFVRDEGGRRKLPVVPWFDLVSDALAREGPLPKPERKLIPDRVHPGDRLHALMAMAVIDLLGGGLPVPAVSGEFTAGRLRMKGPRVPVDLRWKQDSIVTLDLSGVASPVPFMAEDDVIGSPRSIASRELARLPLKIAGLDPATTFRFEAGGTSLGDYTGSELSAGVDLMARTPARQLPKGEHATRQEWCQRTEGNPFANDYYCVYDLIRARDNVDLAVRSDRVKALPQIPEGWYARFLESQSAWSETMQREIALQARSMLARPHLVRFGPVEAFSSP